MSRFGLAFCVAALVVWGGSAADDKKPAEKSKAVEDSPVVAATRKKLDTAVSVNFKDERLADAVKELEKQTELKFRLDTQNGVSQNMAVTYSATDKPLKEVLGEMFKGRGLGFFVHRKQNATDRYEGYVDIVQGDQRGHDAPAKKDASKSDAKAKADKPPKTDPKVDAKPDDGDANEKLASSKLKQAKLLAQEGQAADAKEYCELIINKYPKTKAATEAKEMLEKLKKK